MEQMYLLSEADRAASDLLDMEKYVQWHSRHRLDQVIFRRKGDKFQLIVKAVKNKRFWAAYLDGATWSQVLRLGGEWGVKGLLTWSQDIYPSKDAKAYVRSL